MAFAPFDLSGKVALVTGGNSGIGLGMAEGLAAAGASVCIWGSNEAKNALAQETLAKRGSPVLALRCDVGDEDQVERSFADTVASLGPVDACFVNAGVGGITPSFAEMTTEEWRRVLRVNLDGAFFTLRTAARHMVAAGRGGSLVGTASLSALHGMPRNQHYAASKGALLSMIAGLSVELARHDIRANTLVPGWIDTDLVSMVLASDSFQRKVLTRVPMRRWGAPADFAGIAVYLASDASRYHSGDTFVIDGAYSRF